MSIDKSGKWWVGTKPEDMKEYLGAYSAEGYGTTEFRLARCGCSGADAFGSVGVTEGEFAFQNVPSFVIGMVDMQVAGPLPLHSRMLNELPEAEKGVGSIPRFYPSTRANK